jgi:potassium-dependent mechanosensitive channel
MNILIKTMRFIYSFLILLYACFDTTAQERQETNTQDTTASKPPDTSRRSRRFFDTTLFSDANVLTRSDYLLRLEKIFQILNKVPVVTSSFVETENISRSLKESDSALNLIKERFSRSEGAVNLRNLYMYQALLTDLAEINNDHNEKLREYDSTLDNLKKEILEIRRDSTIRPIFRDSVLRASFRPQIQQLRTKRRATDSLVKLNTDLINDLKAIASATSISIQELIYQADSRLRTVGPRAFGKERRYLWEPRTSSGRPSMREGFRRSIAVERKIAQIYFANDRNQRLMMILTGIVFFCWVFFNFRTLKKRDKLTTLEGMNLRYISPVPVAASLIFMLSLAPFFDLYAPAIYIEFIQFLVMITLTGMFWKRLSRQIFYPWCVFVILFILLSSTRNLGLPYYFQRWWMFGVSVAAIVFGVFLMIRLRNLMIRRKIILLATALYVFFHLLAVICNLFGRVTLAQIFGPTAGYAFGQTISLAIFVQIIVEACLLQIQASRIRKQYPEQFDSTIIAKRIGRFASLLAIALWLLVFTTNLNLYASLSSILVQVLNTPHRVGSFSFTFSGILLFLGIFWIAHLLQKNIGYFFGDTGDDAAFDNKGQRSRLLVTRLILLVAGFLLAVAASGLPVDRITVILGALGVGIGLGLQSIVNNFVSGIILIFDRPIRIGDTVEVGDKKGRVKEIGVRSSTLLTDEGAEVIIPNGDMLSHNIVNWTLSNNHVRVELAYRMDRPTDPEKIKCLVKEVINANDNVLERKDPEVLVNNMSTKTVEVKVYFWCRDIGQTDSTRNEVHTAIYDRLEKEGAKLW